ncbi:DDB1- and CUL4-associated factor 8 isoform X1 [Dendrobium catenatum]|uniref:DDB1- and CUL4-associated factor 8 isoform X1 n=1 Tax=Dendrobium catenatum TaxID=906689 RepID=UPI0009F19117|nr:DDB1- and CUL4-associated factor 8 isoform X1 [Dendrobium catenatum]
MGKIGMREKESGCRIVQMRNREVGALAPRSFFHRASASLDLVFRLGIHRKLDKHRGCVNTVSFNANGNILVSGSDDRMVMLWDWETGLAKLSFHSGHSNNVFQAKFMPYTDERTMVTCAADGEVRMVRLQDGGRVFTKMLARHEGRAHKMALEPGNPHILYSCGEDGLVYHFDLRTQNATKLFKCKSFKDKWDYMPVVHLNAIAIDPRNPNYFAIAGSDEYARVYDIRKCRWDGKGCGNPADCFCPAHLIGDDQVGITGLAFSDQSELLASYNFEAIYLFSKDQGLGPNPDLATPRSAMSVDAIDNAFENLVLPATEDPNAGDAVQVYNGHRNCVTVKGVGFFGPNCEYVTSGSDCGRVFIWRKKGGELLRVMEGDKHVVNCIEPNPSATMLASCGIEKDIKIWIPNAKEPAVPIDIDEQFMKQNPIRFFSRDDADFDIDYSDDGDDDDDDDDNNDDNDNDDSGDSIDFLDVDEWSDHQFSDNDCNDDGEEEEEDDDDGQNAML